MSKRILSKTNCSFVCSCLAGVITIQQLENRLHNGSDTALTKNTMLTGAGICSKLTSMAGGFPTLCTLKMAKNWIAGFELQKKINGVSLLNEDAKMLCTVGGTITVQKPLLPPTPVPVLAVPVTKFKSSNSKVTDSSSSQSNSVAESNQNNKTTDSKSDVSDTESKQLENNSNQQSEKTVNQENTQQALCAYGSCDKMGSCPYLNASGTISTDGAAAKLRRNSSEKEKNYDSICDERMEKYKISWGNQAHHMISAKAAYCQYPELVKLGNYFGYDINCQENCYFLPAWEKGDGYGEKSSHFKKAQAYEVMKASGMQWHVGQHNYSIDLPQKVLEKYPQLKGMDCYNDKINKDVKAILAECNKKFDGICPEENYDVYKNWFIKKMNALSESVEEYLDLFGSYPKDSFPYFVSLEALRYAYEIPRSGKVISIHKTKAKWVLRRYQYTNYLKDDEFQLNPLESKELYDTENHWDSTIRNLIIFCQNVSCFIVISESNDFKLPFTYNATCCYITSEDAQSIKSHFSAMLAEKADSGEDDYIPPKMMIKQRLKECGLE